MATGQAGFFEKQVKDMFFTASGIACPIVVAVFLTLVFRNPLSAIASFMRTCSAAVVFCKCCERGYKKTTNLL